MMRERAETGFARASYAYGVLGGAVRSLVVQDQAAILEHGLSESTPSPGPPRRYVVVYWVADTLPLLIATLRSPPLRRFFGSLCFLLDETAGGRASAYVIRRLGGRYVLLQRSPSPGRLRQLREILATPGSYAFAVDGGGPYFEASTGVIGLADSIKATLVPLAARADPCITVPRAHRLQVPLPGCRVAFATGRPIAVMHGDDRRAAARRLTRALDETRQGLSGALAGAAAG